MSGRLTPATVEAVKERADIVELARVDTELRKAGIEWVGRCPFHQERTGRSTSTPSSGSTTATAVASAATRSRTCGSATRSTSPGAIEWLAERFNVPLEYEEESPRSRRAGAGRTAGASSSR